MRDPRKYTPALLLCQSGVTAIYTIVGAVVYYYCGSFVSSPALGSAGGDVKKIAYGFALPGLIVTTTIVSHVSCAAYINNENQADSLFYTDPGKVHLRPPPPRLPPSKQQHDHPLGLLVELHIRHYRNCIHNR